MAAYWPSLNCAAAGAGGAVVAGAAGGVGAAMVDSGGWVVAGVAVDVGAAVVDSGGCVVVGAGLVAPRRVDGLDADADVADGAVDRGREVGVTEPLGRDGDGLAVLRDGSAPVDAAGVPPVGTRAGVVTGTAADAVVPAWATVTPNVDPPTTTAPTAMAIR